MRAFIAIDLGDAERRALSRSIEQGQTASPDSRWARTAQLHVTLVFLGNVADEQIAVVEGAMANTATAHTELCLSVGEPGIFGSPQRPSVLFVGLAGDLAGLASLQTGLAESLSSVAPSEARAWNPHITLARARDRRGDATLAAARERLLPASRGPTDPFTVSEIVLYRSDTRPTGAIYSRVSAAALRPRAA